LWISFTPAENQLVNSVFTLIQNAPVHPTVVKQLLFTPQRGINCNITAPLEIQITAAEMEMPSKTSYPASPTLIASSV
jgi:hypothetical protein